MNQNSFLQSVFPINRSMPSDRLPPTPNQLCVEALPISSHVSPDFSQVNKFSGFSLDVISASSYPVPETTNLKAGRTERGSRQTHFGGLSISDREEKTKEPGIARFKVNSQFIQSNKKLKSGSPAVTDDASKKRGRPRLDTRDETAAEVCPILLNHNQSLTLLFSDVEHRYGLHNGPIDLERRPRFPR